MTELPPGPPGISDGLTQRLERGTRTAKLGLLVNGLLAIIKLLSLIHISEPTRPY